MDCRAATGGILPKGRLGDFTRAPRRTEERVSTVLTWGTRLPRDREGTEGEPGRTYGAEMGLPGLGYANGFFRVCVCV